MYFSQIKHWKLPWWQPKWLRPWVKKRITSSDQAALILTQLDQFRIWFGIGIGILLIGQMDNFTSLTFSTFQQWITLPGSVIVFFNAHLTSIVYFSWLVASMVFILYNWIRHFQTHTIWGWLDVFAESIVMPFIMGGIVVALGLCLFGLPLNFKLTPLIGTLIGALISWMVIEYGFILTSWQYFWLSHLSISHGFKDSLL